MQITNEHQFHQHFRQLYLNYKIGRCSTWELTTNAKNLQTHYLKLFSQIDPQLAPHIQTAIDFSNIYKQDSSQALVKLNAAYDYFHLTDTTINPTQWRTMHDELIWLEGDDQKLLDIDIALRQYHIQAYEVHLGKIEQNHCSWPLVAFQSRFDLSHIESKAESINNKLKRHDYKNDDKRSQLESSYEKLYQKTRLESLPSQIQVFQLLKEFYHERHQEYGTQLIIVNYDFAYNAIINAGCVTYSQLSLKQQKKYLPACQQEFIDFGIFLKRKFIPE